MDVKWYNIYEIFQMLNCGFEILLTVDFRFLQLRLTRKTSVVLLESKNKNNLLLKLYPISQHDIRIVRLLI